MNKEKLSSLSNFKVITKRRLCNSNKEYLVQSNESTFNWKKLDRSIQREAQEYDEEQKGILPYFPTFFEIPNPKVHIYIEDQMIQVSYNGRKISLESGLSKKARLEIHKELNSLLPVQLYESMYQQAKEKIKTEKISLKNKQKQ